MTCNILTSLRHLLSGAAIVAFPLAIAAVAADPPAPAAEKRLEDSLDSDLFDGLKPAKPAPAKPDPDKQPVAPPRPAPERKPGPAADEELNRSLDADLNEELGQGKQDPLVAIRERMKAVERQLAGKDASDATVAKQQQIVDQLDKLIEELAKKQCKPSPNSQASKGGPAKPGGQPMGTKPAGDPMGQPRGDKPATDSRDDVQQGKNEQTDMLAGQRARLLKAWGHLPPKLREQLMNATLDEFLPAYERLIEDYYKRLAEDGAEKP